VYRYREHLILNLVTEGLLVDFDLEAEVVVCLTAVFLIRATIGMDDGPASEGRETQHHQLLPTPSSKI
jgi:hypothetical protein